MYDIAAPLFDPMEDLVRELKALRSEVAALRSEALRNSRPYFYLGDNRAMTTLLGGQPFFVNTQDQALTPWILLGGHWETYADDIVSSYVRPGMTIVDVGANVGYYAVKWGGLAGAEGRLYAFEPNPTMAALLYDNVLINGLRDRARIYPLAVSDHAGTADFTSSPSNTGCGSLRPKVVDADMATYTVAIDTLDHVLADVDRVDLMKIDVEGCEALVLRGGNEILARSPKCAFHIEAQDSWLDYGTFKSILEPISEDRCIFVLRRDKVLMPIDINDVEAYVMGPGGKMCDLFMCPPQDEYLGRVRHFMGR